MCARYTLKTPVKIIAHTFELTGLLDLQPRLNIAPTQTAPVVRQTDTGREAAMLRSQDLFADLLPLSESLVRARIASLVMAVS